MMTVIFLLTFLILLFYVSIIICFTFGFFLTHTYNDEKQSQLPFLSVIIAVRNEEENVDNLLKSLVGQTYPSDKFEIIIIDDYSDDQTLSKLKSNNYFNLIKFFSLKSEQLPGSKKNAVKLGIKRSLGDIIVMTDADCLHKKYWLSTIASFYVKYKPKMIIAPVKLIGKGVFSKIQSLEFSSLIACTCGSAYLGRPVMCNGANLAFEKSIFQEKILRSEYLSGDDMFIMQSIIKRFGCGSVMFLKSFDAIAFTSSQKSIKAFFNQRIRWTSKAPGYTDANIIMTAIAVLLMSVLILGLFISSIFLPDLLKLALIGFLIKIVVDFPIIYGINKFLKSVNEMILYLPEQILYIIYIPLISIATVFSKFSWKGRNNKS